MNSRCSDVQAVEPCPVSILLEEYRQLYTLIVVRLNELQSRIPLSTATLTAILGSVGLLSPALQLLLLVTLPWTPIWLVRTTANAARSLEDALRRVEELEEEINARMGEPLLIFQSSHPSRGLEVGGRTGTETVEAVMAASALLLGGCVWMVWSLFEPPAAWFVLYVASVVAVTTSLIKSRLELRSYRYQKRMQGCATLPPPIGSPRATPES